MQNAVIFGRSYNCFERGTAVPSDGAVAAAEHFAKRRGVGVWARRDLSAWLPGSSALMIVGRGLKAADAACFGFVSLAGE